MKIKNILFLLIGILFLSSLVSADLFGKKEILLVKQNTNTTIINNLTNNITIIINNTYYVNTTNNITNNFTVSIQSLTPSYLYVIDNNLSINLSGFDGRYLQSESDPVWYGDKSNYYNISQDYLNDSQNINSSLNDRLGNNYYYDFMQQNSIITNNPFAPTQTDADLFKIYNGELDNSFLNADKKFLVTTYGWTTMNVHSLFDGDYENFGNVCNATQCDIFINYTAYGAVADVDYPYSYAYGDIIVSNYYNWNTINITGQIFCQNGVVGNFSWHNLTTSFYTSNSGFNNLYFLSNNNAYYQCTALNISVFGNTSLPSPRKSTVSEIEYRLTRPITVRGSFINKRYDENLFFDLYFKNDSNSIQTKLGKNSYFLNSLGVGTNVPSAKLHINGSNEILRLEDTSSTGNPYMTFYQNGIRRSFVQQNDANDTLIIASEYGDLAFKSASSLGSDSDTEYVRLKSGGFLGIGTSSPSQKVDILNGWLQTNFSTSGNGGLIIYNSQSSALSRGRITSYGNPGGQLNINVNGVYSGSGSIMNHDDGTLPYWDMVMDPRNGVDSFKIRRAPIGNATSTSDLLVINGSGFVNITGKFNVVGNAMIMGNIDINGNFTGNQLYGEAWFHNDSGVSLSISNTNIYYNVTLINGSINNGVYLLNDNKTMNVSVSGLYLVNLDMSFGGSVNHLYHVPLLLNNAEIEKCEPHVNMGVGSDVVSVSKSCSVRLVNGDLLNLGIRDSTGSSMVTFYDASLNIVRIGN